MKPVEVFKHLKEVTEATTLTLAPGPLVIRVNTRDAMAARLIEWLTNQLPDDATLGEFLNILAAAEWWTTFWSSLENGKTESAL